MKRHNSKPSLYWRLRRTAILLGLILVLMTSGTFWFLRLPAEATSGLLSSVTTAPKSIGGNGSRIVNILLVGQDRREDEGRTRADSMILCTFNKRTRELTLTSFLRDLYVPIPGHGSDRINAAYAYGGMSLLENTLEQNFNLKIDGTIEVDFTQFSGIVDTLGGVSLEIREDEAAVISQETGTELSGGLQTLNGDQALAYARIRKLDADGDFTRTSRQRKVMEALLGGYRSADLPTILRLTNDLLPMISTDLGPLEIIGYALELFPLLSGAQLQQQHIPAAGSYSDQVINGMAVLVPDLEAARQLLSETLLGI